jgi:hypothetical protein
MVTACNFHFIPQQKKGEKKSHRVEKKNREKNGRKI